MKLSRRHLSDLVAFAAATARSAGQILKAGFDSSMRVDYKGRIDPVTEYDLRAERHIVGAIAKAYPDHAVLTEEGNNRESPSEFRWVIDPLDGTVNYAHRFPVYCTSIGLEHNGRVVAGAVYDPERDEMFTATLGGGAKLNGQRFRVSTTSRMDRALIATGFAYDVATARRNNLGYFARVARKAQGVRRPGAAALDIVWTACGRFDAFWELKLHPWDVAAASLCVLEAGGKVTRCNGKPWDIFADDCLASNGKLHRPMLATLTGR